MRDQHFVQFYKADEPMLNRNVGQFLWEGLLRGDGLLVIATAARRQSLTDHLTRLGADVTLAQKEGQLLLLDAEEMLDQFMVEGGPDRSRFQTVLGGALASIKPRLAGASICAYGEMVGVLWERGHRTAAIRLEECWNELLASGGVILFCGYPIDVFDEDFGTSDVQEVLRAHTHVMPTAANGSLKQAVQKAMRQVLGGEIEEESLGLNGENTLLWVMNRERQAKEILELARQYFEDSRPSSPAEPTRN